MKKDRELRWSVTVHFSRRIPKREGGGVMFWGEEVARFENLNHARRFARSLTRESAIVSDLRAQA